MNTKRIIRFLKAVAANNNRPWFQEHKAEYDAIRADFEEGVARAIGRIADFDPSIAHLSVKDCTYRFYRDTRFSPDKSPYKRHLGAYICARGKKSLHGGYYMHVEPGHSMLACGTYWLPTNILTSCRNELMANIDEWRRIVESRRFVELFGTPGQTAMTVSGSGDVEMQAPQGFGIAHLKSAPSGFPKDYAHIEYLRMKDYCCWRQVPDSFFEGDGWLDQMAEVFETARPMMDFMNVVIDDYE